MTDKTQHTTASLRDKMLQRYSDGLHHKHNKIHHSHRHHNRTHPCIQANGKDEENITNGSTGMLREFKLRKTRKRLDKGRIH